MQKRKKDFAVCGEGTVTDQPCQKCFVNFHGTINILAKKFFAGGLSYVLEDV